MHVLRFASLDLGELATSFCLLRLPKMPELKTKHDNLDFVPAGPEVNIHGIAFKDKTREKVRASERSERKRRRLLARARATLLPPAQLAQEKEVVGARTSDAPPACSARAREGGCWRARERRSSRLLSSRKRRTLCALPSCVVWRKNDRTASAVPTVPDSPSSDAISVLCCASSEYAVPLLLPRFARSPCRACVVQRKNDRLALAVPTVPDSPSSDAISLLRCSFR
jgi:hypothetical protein